VSPVLDKGSRRHRGRPFVVAVAGLLREPGSRRQVEVDAPIEDLAVSGSHVPDGALVHVSALLESVHDGILVSGTVSAKWEGACRRCLDEARGELCVPVRELCVEGGDVETTYALLGDELDLEPIAHDACILELPLAPLCNEGCLGLCPECGVNRNLEQCSCDPAPDPRWGPLALLGGGAPQARVASSAAGPEPVPGETTE